MPGQNAIIDFINLRQNGKTQSAGSDLLNNGNRGASQSNAVLTMGGKDWLLNYGKDRQNNTASTTETGSTVKNDNPAVHTAVENANIQKYSAAANEAFNAATAQQVRIDDIAGKISEALVVPYTPGKRKPKKYTQNGAIWKPTTTL